MNIRSLSIGAACLALGACGGDEPPADVRDEIVNEASRTPQNVEEAVGQLINAFGGEGAEAIAAKDLKAMLPETVKGMKRTRASGSKNGAMGITISVAEADFEGDDPEDYQTLSLKISDLGAMQSMARMGLDWLAAEMDEESEDGFYRTTEYKGHKALESYEDNGASAKGQMMVFIQGRFLIDASSVNVPFDTLKDVVDTLPVDDLDKIAASGG